MWPNRHSLLLFKFMCAQFDASFLRHHFTLLLNVKNAARYVSGSQVQPPGAARGAFTESTWVSKYFYYSSCILMDKSLKVKITKSWTSPSWNNPKTCTCTWPVAYSYLAAFVTVFTLRIRSLIHTSSEPQSFVKGIWSNNRAENLNAFFSLLLPMCHFLKNSCPWGWKKQTSVYVTLQKDSNRRNTCATCHWKKKITTLRYCVALFCIL